MVSFRSYCYGKSIRATDSQSFRILWQSTFSTRHLAGLLTIINRKRKLLRSRKITAKKIRIRKKLERTGKKAKMKRWTVSRMRIQVKTMRWLSWLPLRLIMAVGVKLSVSEDNEMTQLTATQVDNGGECKIVCYECSINRQISMWVFL